MNDHTESHTPSPEFRASLKRELARTFRETQFAEPRGARRARRIGMFAGGVLGVVVALAAGLAFGTSTGYAAARMDGDRRLGEMAASTIGASSELVALRLDLAHVRTTLTQPAVVKSAAPAALLAAESELRAMEASAERIEFDLTQSGNAVAPAASSSIPMKRALALTCSALAFGAPPAPQGVPIVDLPAAKVKAFATFGGVLGIREVPGGKVLVNDGGRRQLLLYDTTLTSPRVVFDSTDGDANSYGPRGVPLVRYTGDSSLMVDVSGGAPALLVLDGRGQIARALALPRPMDAGSFGSGMSGTDNKGRLLYALSGRISGTPAGSVGAQETFPDSTPVLRADLELRRTDTIGRVSRNKGEWTRIDHTDPLKIIRTVIVNPLPEPDEWAVLSDGSVAFIRGHDYHIDWLRPDGTTSSTPRMPFDWKRVSDDDKQKLIDSANTAHAAQNALAAATRNAPPPPPPPPVAMDASGGTQRTGGGAGVTHAAYDAMGTLWVPLSYETVAAKDIPDYYPAIRKGAAMADLDNHLWILPTTSAQSRNGELVYDVVNTKGELFERVRVPAGRSIAGFGKGGVVYLQAGDRTNGFTLERTKLPAASR